MCDGCRRSLACRARSYVLLYQGDGKVRLFKEARGNGGDGSRDGGSSEADEGAGEAGRRGKGQVAEESSGRRARGPWANPCQDTFSPRPLRP